MTHKIPVPLQAAEQLSWAKKITKTDLQNCLSKKGFDSYSTALMSASKRGVINELQSFSSHFLTLITVFKKANRNKLFLMPHGTSVVNNITNLKSTIL